MTPQQVATACLTTELAGVPDEAIEWSFYAEDVRLVLSEVRSLREELRQARIGYALLQLEREREMTAKLVIAARWLVQAADGEMERLSESIELKCPSDPCEYCSAIVEMNAALMDYDDMIVERATPHEPVVSSDC